MSGGSVSNLLMTVNFLTIVVTRVFYMRIRYHGERARKVEDVERFRLSVYYAKEPSGAASFSILIKLSSTLAAKSASMA